MGRNVIPGSADRDDVDPHATAIAFEPCRVEDALPPRARPGDLRHRGRFRQKDQRAGFQRQLHALHHSRSERLRDARPNTTDAFALLSTVLGGRRPAGWRGWAEVVWSDARVPDYIGDMPHTWIGAEFATAIRRMLIRENGVELQLFRAVPELWWRGRGIHASRFTDRFRACECHSQAARIACDNRTRPDRACP